VAGKNKQGGSGQTAKNNWLWTVCAVIENRFVDCSNVGTLIVLSTTSWLFTRNHSPARPPYRMFYSQIILAKKGPLGKVWQAAHWGDKKISRPAIFATDISQVADSIQHPAAPMALRVSGHLLLGVVRIYSRKVKYLVDDCQQAMVKVKLAYSGGGTGAGHGNDGTGSNAAGNTASIDIIRKKGGHAANNLNVSHFGEYTAVDFSNVAAASNFQIPRLYGDDDEEEEEDDWVPAELDESALNLPGASTIAGAASMNDSTTLGGDHEEEEEEGTTGKKSNKNEDDSTVSDIEKTRAASTNESMTSDPNMVRLLHSLQLIVKFVVVGCSVFWPKMTGSSLTR
jgi:cohesin complex subunit SCC1